MKKQIILFFVILLPMVASAESTTGTDSRGAIEIDSIYYYLNSTNKTASVTTIYSFSRYEIYDDENQLIFINENWYPIPSYSGNVIIPTEVTYNNETYSVTGIADEAFRDCEDLTSVVIPNSVTSIGSYAFYGTGWYNNQTNGLLYLSNWLLGYKGNKPRGSLSIRSGVRGIASYAFQDCIDLTSITIPNSVTSIGVGAFYGCSGLTSVTIPNSVTSIDYMAFYGCSGLTSVTIPESVTSIGSIAFEGCSGLTSVTIPESVTSIGSYAFYGCNNLISVVAEMITPVTIYSSTFSNRVDATLYVPKGSKSAYENADYWKEFKKIVEIDNNIIFADSNVKALCIARWDMDRNGIFTYDEAAAVLNLGTVFQNKTDITSFDELQFFTGLTSIGSSAFNGCSSLTSVTIPENVTSIGSSAFNGCSSLTSVHIIDLASWCNVTFGDAVSNPLYYSHHLYLNGTEITDLIIPEGLTSVNSFAFYGCFSLSSVTIPNSVSSIGASAFQNCSSLTSVHISDLAAWCNISFESIYANPLYYAHHLFLNETEITNLIIPEGVTSINSFAFYDCIGLVSITISKSVTSIGKNSFYGTKWYHDQSNGILYLNNWLLGYKGNKPSGALSIQSGVRGIAASAFYDCSDLTSVIIPESVTSIGENAFANCSSLTSVTVGMITPVMISLGTFSNSANATLYVPQGSKSAYENADYWNEFKEIVEFIPEQEIITFADANVKAVCLANWDTDGNGLLTYDEAAAVMALGTVFENKTDITAFDELQYFTGLTAIGGCAFYGCRNLTFVTIPNSVTTIGNYAFYNCI